MQRRGDAELRDWLAADVSMSVGWRGTDRTLHESIGHMRRVIGTIRRHLAQEPVNIVTSRWRYSLMNWGRDPLRSRL